MALRIRAKILRVILSTSLGVVAILSAAAVTGILSMRREILTGGGKIGEIAYARSGESLEEQVRRHIAGMAGDKADLTSAKFRTVENRVRMIADIAGRIYSNPGRYPPRAIDYLHPDQAGQLIPHLSSAPGFSLAAHRDEVYRFANIVDMLRQAPGTDIEIHLNYAGTESGFTIGVGYWETPNETDYDARVRPWYIGAKAAGDIFWTDAITSYHSGVEIIVCAMPFYETANGMRIFRGAAGIDMEVSETVNNILESAEIGQNGYAFILDREGRVIFASKNGTAGDSRNIAGEDYLKHERKDVRDLAARMTRGEAGIQKLDLNGESVYIAYNPLPTVKWSLAVVVPETEVLSPVEENRQNILSLTRTELGNINREILGFFLVIGASVLILIGIVIFSAGKLANGIAAPIIAMDRDARIISKGNMEHVLSVKTGDELETLAESFDDMIKNIKKMSAGRERVETELNIAAAMQASMLPHKFPESEDFELYAEMLPAREVGGDFYDFFFTGERRERLVLLTADVSGKGIPAALFMVTARSLIRSQAQTGESLEQILFQVNNQLCENNEESMFTAVFFCVVDLSRGSLEFINAGHNFPLFARKDSPFSFFESSRGLPLGVEQNVHYTTERFFLEEGDTLFLYTKGMTDMENHEGEIFGKERLLEAADEFRNLAPRQFDEACRQRLAAFLNGAEPDDDITTLIFRYRGKKPDVSRGAL